MKEEIERVKKEYDEKKKRKESKAKEDETKKDDKAKEDPEKNSDKTETKTKDKPDEVSKPLSFAGTMFSNLIAFLVGKRTLSPRQFSRSRAFLLCKSFSTSNDWTRNGRPKQPSGTGSAWPTRASFHLFPKVCHESDSLEINKEKGVVFQDRPHATRLHPERQG